MLPTADWAFMTTWLWIHILAVPTLQNALGLKSMYAVFALHWASQIMFHRNLNKSVICCTLSSRLRHC